MDDAQHRREEEERRNKRKASKAFKSEARKEKERKLDEHRRKVLNQQGSGIGSNASKKIKDTTGSKFQEIFLNRAQGFHIDFRFRNAPPRPPVGPTFVGHTLDSLLTDLCRQYKQYNAVEAGYTWRLHTEPDLGVPLAPSAMNLKSYPKSIERMSASTRVNLHPDDDALLNWKGSLGDTAGEMLKQRQDRARAATRAALSKKVPAVGATHPPQYLRRPAKKDFSRVLHEDMQTWMKKTTYLSNDYSRKVHDFKSLAQTKQEIVYDLAAKQEELSKRRSVLAVKKSFDPDSCPISHPTKKNLKHVSVTQLLPNVSNWGRAFTHVVIDKSPILNKQFNSQDMEVSIVAHVERKHANSRMTCQLLLPVISHDELSTGGAVSKIDVVHYRAAQAFDLDVVPLKEESSPHVHFCFLVDTTKEEATYLPIASRVQLSSGRPIVHGGSSALSRRALTKRELDEMEEHQAEVDRDMAEKHHISLTQYRRPDIADEKEHTVGSEGSARKTPTGRDENVGEGDFGDGDSSSDSDGDGFFGDSRKTIVADG